MTAVSVAFASQATLGESPRWSQSSNGLLWVDTLGASLNLFDPVTGKNTARSIPSPLGFVTEADTGTLFIGVGCHVETIDQSGRMRRVATAPHAQAGYRLNDARLDLAGRLWVGLMDEALREDSGYLYRLDPDGTWHTIDSGFTLVNGLDWSRDRRTLYVTDSRRGIIYAYDHDPVSGDIGNRRILISLDPDIGKPDGLIVDQEGFLLSVLFDGAAIARISPAGKIERLIDLPVPRPTSCTLDGRGRYLFITSAQLGLSQRELEEAPASGSLLQLDYPWMLHASFLAPL